MAPPDLLLSSTSSQSSDSETDPDILIAPMHYVNTVCDGESSTTLVLCNTDGTDSPDDSHVYGPENPLSSENLSHGRLIEDQADANQTGATGGAISQHVSVSPIHWLEVQLGNDTTDQLPNKQCFEDHAMRVDEVDLMILEKYLKATKCKSHISKRMAEDFYIETYGPDHMTRSRSSSSNSILSDSEAASQSNLRQSYTFLPDADFLFGANKNHGQQNYDSVNKGRPKNVLPPIIPVTRELTQMIDDVERSSRCNNIRCDIFSCSQMKDRLSRLSGCLRSEFAEVCLADHHDLLLCLVHHSSLCCQLCCPVPHCHVLRDLNLENQAMLDVVRALQHEYTSFADLTSRDNNNNTHPVCLLGERGAILVTDRSGTSWAVIRPVRRIEELTDAKVAAHKKLKALHHENIAQLLWTLTTGQDIYLCMPFQFGLSVRELLHKVGRLTEDECIENLHQCLAALNFLHQHHIVCLTFQASNLYFTTHTQGHLCLTNLTHALCLSHDPPSNIHTFAALLPPTTLPPELSRASYPTCSADIWLCACFLYEMWEGVTLRADIVHEPRNVILRRIHEEPVPPMPAISSAKIRALFTDMFQEDPALRKSAQYLMTRC